MSQAQTIIAQRHPTPMNPTSPAPDASPHLPHEIIHRIFTFSSQSSLSSCLRVSHRCFNLAAPLLYRHLIFRGSIALSPFESMLDPSSSSFPHLSKATLLKHTRILELDYITDAVHHDWPITSETHSPCWFPNLEILTMIPPTKADFTSMYSFESIRGPHRISQQCHRISKLIIYPGNRRWYPKFHQKAGRLRKLVRCSMPEDLWWTNTESGGFYAQFEDMVDISQVEVVFLALKDLNRHPLRIIPLKLSYRCNIIDSRATDKQVPKSITIVNIESIYPAQLRWEGQSLKGSEENWEEGRYDDHGLELNMQDEAKRVLKETLTFLVNKGRGVKQEDRVKYYRFEEKVEFVRLEEYIARGDHELEMDFGSLS